MVRVGFIRRRLGVALLAACCAIGGVLASTPATAEPGRADLARLTEAEAAAVADLVAAEAAVAGAERRRVALEEEAVALEGEVREARRRAATARANARIARAALADRLEALYRRGDTDPIIVLLSAESLSDAIAELDALQRAVLRDQALTEQTTVGVRRARSAERRLAEREAELATARAAAAEEERRLAATRAARAATLTQTRAQLADRRAALARVEAAATAVSDTVAAINDAASTPAAPAAATVTSAPAPTGPVGAGRVLRVKAYAYTGGGLTASGIPTGPGRCAVDPAVIPLGTRFEVPGYGPCLAADTGYLIDGATIDVWLPSKADTYRWGIKYLDIVILG